MTLASLLTAVTSGLVAASLIAATPADARAAGSRPSEGAAAYESCKRLYAIESYGEAIRTCKQAYLLDADPAILYTLAQSYRWSGDPADAAAFYEQFLAAEGPRYAPSKRAAIEALVVQLRAEAARTPSASGAVATPPPLPLPASPPAPRPAPWYADETGDALLAGGTVVAIGGALLFAHGLSLAGDAGQAATLGAYDAEAHRAAVYEWSGVGLFALAVAIVAGGVAWDESTHSDESAGSSSAASSIDAALAPGGGWVSFQTSF